MRHRQRLARQSAKYDTIIFMKTKIPPFKEFAIGTTMRAGTILMRNFQDSFRIRATRKNPHEFVTKSDLEVHRFMYFKIKEQFPDHNFISEEGDLIDNGSSYTWVVDPLDGTLNYMIRNPFFSVSLTLMVDGVPTIGVIYGPFNREMFVAVKGQSARLNERNIHVSKERRLNSSVLSYSYFKRDKKSRARSLKVLGTFEDKSRSMRHLGCTTLELAYVACGRMEAQIISPPLRQWDVAAGMVMIAEAGGKITNFKGEPVTGLGDGLVCSNGLIHSQILKVLKQHRV